MVFHLPIAPPLPPASERDVLVNEGHTIVLSVDLSEITNPDPTYTWQSEGGASFPMEQEAQGGQRVYITEEGTLVIRYVTVEDSGTYHCTVQNEHGMSVQTVNLHVVAVTPPSLALLTQHIVKDCEDIEVSLQCIKVKALNLISTFPGEEPHYIQVTKSISTKCTIM